jgi:hypothetical protein
MSYTIEHLVLSRRYDEAVQMLNDMSDDTLFSVLTIDQFEFVANDPTWAADDPEHDLAVAKVRERLLLDLQVVYRDAHDPLTDGWELTNAYLPGGGGRIVSAIINEDEFYEDDGALDQTFVMTPVNRLNRLHPLCGERLTAPPAGWATNGTTYTLNVSDHMDPSMFRTPQPSQIRYEPLTYVPEGSVPFPQRTGLRRPPVGSPAAGVRAMNDLITEARRWFDDDDSLAPDDDGPM